MYDRGVRDRSGHMVAAFIDIDGPGLRL